MSHEAKKKQAVHNELVSYLPIKTHDSELQDQEAGCTQRTSELFTCNIAVKFGNAINKLPLKLSLSY